jgi:hypothetical protein
MGGVRNIVMVLVMGVSALDATTDDQRNGVQENAEQRRHLAATRHITAVRSMEWVGDFSRVESTT